MKKIILSSVALYFLSCGAKKETPAKESVEKIVAVYTVNKTKNISVLLRKITKTVKFDSVEMKDGVFIDTVWGYPSVIPMKDSLGKVILDSLQKPKMQEVYNVISKDSVNWHIENKSVDSLIK